MDKRLFTHLDLWLSDGLFAVMVLGIILAIVVVVLSLLLVVVDAVSMLFLSLDAVDVCEITLCCYSFGSHQKSYMYLLKVLKSTTM